MLKPVPPILIHNMCHTICIVHNILIHNMCHTIYIVHNILIHNINIEHTVPYAQYNIHTVQYGHYTIYTIQNAHSEHVQIGHYAQCTLVTGYNAHYHSTTLYSIEHTTHSNQYMHTVCYAHDYILNTTSWFVSHTVFLIDLGLGGVFQDVSGSLSLVFLFLPLEAP